MIDVADRWQMSLADGDRCGCCKDGQFLKEYENTPYIVLRQILGSHRYNVKGNVIACIKTQSQISGVRQECRVQVQRLS